MSYLFLTPPAPPGTKGKSPANTQALSAYLGALADTCTVDPNSGARVCTSDTAPPIIPVPPTPAPAPCPPCPAPIACPPAPACAPCRSPVTPPIVASPILGRPIAAPIRAVPNGFARYSQLANAVRARMMQLEGLGDECQVYANGARVCNAPGPAPAPPQMVTVCTDEPIPMPLRSNLARPVMVGAPYGPAANMIARPPVRTRRVCRQIPAAASVPAATPYTTSTVAPVDNTTLPAAPVPVDTTTASTFPSFDFSSVPTWAWYVLFAGGVYWLFFKRR